jgi:hypothetical protein
MNLRQYGDFRTISGIGLVLLGLIFFAATQGLFGLDWGNSWPAYLLVLGVLGVLGALTNEAPQTRAAVATFGVFLTLLSLFFFATTLGYVSWGDQAVLWPIYPLILGVALLAGYWAGGSAQPGYLTGGLILVVLGGVFLVITLFLGWAWFTGFWERLPVDWGRHWPLALLLASVVLFVAAFLVGTRQARPGPVIFGTILLGLGLFFYATTLGWISQDAQGRWWPVYPLIVGLALLVGYFASAQEQRGLLISGLIVAAAGAVALLTLLIFGDGGFARGWPLVLVLIGVVLLFLRARPTPHPR